MFCIHSTHFLTGSLCIRSNAPFRPKNILSSRRHLSSPIYASQSQFQTVESDPNNKYKSSIDFLTCKPYTPPSWAAHLNHIPTHHFSLGHFPTPIHRWNLPNLPKGTEVWLKRDDLSGVELGGNKARKLEFLMADAVAKGADCVITIGFIQSNHCRATAVAAKHLNLDSHVILGTSKAVVDQDPGLSGNLLVERLAGANVHLISTDEDHSHMRTDDWLQTFTKILEQKLLKEGRKPYVIPAGGSNYIGNWGYIEAINEIKQQVEASNDKLKFDDIIAACGSGGTIAGLLIGAWFGNLNAKVHAFSIFDHHGFFYDIVQDLINAFDIGINARDVLNVQHAEGLGYAMSTSDELQFLKEVATTTGVVLDPVYSGKAAYAMMKDMEKNPKKWEDRKILFIHTGGLLGLYDKVDQMSSLVKNCLRMEV